MYSFGNTRVAGCSLPNCPDFRYNAFATDLCGSCEKRKLIKLLVDSLSDAELHILFGHLLPLGPQTQDLSDDAGTQTSSSSDETEILEDEPSRE